MRIKLKLNLLILILIIFSFGLTGSYHAKADVGPGIAVAPEYPKEQIKNNGIFNVIFKSNKRYNLTLQIINNDNENKNVTISPNTAYTSDNGNIMFDKPSATNDSSIGYNFRSLFDQKEQKVTVPAKTIKRVSFGLKMPPKSYKGIIVGGFYITIPNNSKTNVKSNFQIKNDFSYGLAAAIHNNKEKYQPNIQLGNINVNNYNNQMQVKSDIKNIESAIISGMNVKSEIIKNSNNKIVSKSNRSNLSMAPNSSFNYENIIENSLSPGKYKLHLNITDDNGHTWNENKTFRVNTREYVSHFTKKVPWILYILIGIIVLLVFVIILLIYYQLRKNNKNQSNDNIKN